MILPLNYYDSIVQWHATLVDCAEKDAQDLLAAGWNQPLPTLTEKLNPNFETAIQNEVDTFVRNSAKLGNCSEAFVREKLKTSEKGKAKINAYLDQANYDYRCVLNFTLGGKKSFYFSDGLVQQLADTEMNVRADLLRLPFPSCMFVFTSRDAINSFHKFMPADRELLYDVPLTVFVSEFQPLTGEDSRCLEIWAFHGADGRLLAGASRNLALCDGMSIEEVLKTDWRSTHRGAEEESTRGSGIDLFYTDGLHFFRIVVNAILYASSINAELTDCPSIHDGLEERLKTLKSLARRDLYRAAQKASFLPYVLVGGSVKEVSGSRSASEALASRTLTVRFSVRGHFRNQAFGPGHSQHRLKFIEPYLKGPEMADLVNKPYCAR